jgi:hypothetical protein
MRISNGKPYKQPDKQQHEELRQRSIKVYIQHYTVRHSKTHTHTQITLH